MKNSNRVPPSGGWIGQPHESQWTIFQVKQPVGLKQLRLLLSRSITGNKPLPSLYLIGDGESWKQTLQCIAVKHLHLRLRAKPPPSHPLDHHAAYLGIFFRRDLPNRYRFWMLDYIGWNSDSVP